MNESTKTPRRYDGRARAAAAAATRGRILAAAKTLMAPRGVDAVTMADIARAAEVAESTLYAVFRSKEGILTALMEASLFGATFRAAQAQLAAEPDPVAQIALTAQVARAIYEAERNDLGRIRDGSRLSEALRAVEADFEARRYEMQRNRIRALFGTGRARVGLSEEEARRVMWMLTGRGPYAALVEAGGWTADRYAAWLAEALLRELVAPEQDARQA
jgi:AcrR family transcriptional regulator